jgi:hypothetical protein
MVLLHGPKEEPVDKADQVNIEKPIDQLRCATGHHQNDLRCKLSDLPSRKFVRKQS